MSVPSSNEASSDRPWLASVCRLLWKVFGFGVTTFFRTIFPAKTLQSENGTKKCYDPILARTAWAIACTSFKGKEADSSVIELHLLFFQVKQKSSYNATMSVIEAISPYGQFLGELHHCRLT
jgi:hypothetical protein